MKSNFYKTPLVIPNQNQAKLQKVGKITIGILSAGIFVELILLANVISKIN